MKKESDVQLEAFPQPELDLCNEILETLQKDIEKREAALEGAKAALDLRVSLFERFKAHRNFVAAHVPAQVNGAEESEPE